MAKLTAVVQLGALILLVAMQMAAAAHWGDFARSDCQRKGFRKWYSRLWDIKGDWNSACRSTPATVNNFYFPAPDNCVDKGIGGMWGEFYVPDGSCNSLWSSVHKTEACSAAKPGFSKYVAKLEVDTSNVDASLRGSSLPWSSYVLCRGKEAIIEGVHFSRPDQCVYKGAEGTFGEFFIRDFGCDGAAIEEVV